MSSLIPEPKELFAHLEVAYRLCFQLIVYSLFCFEQKHILMILNLLMLWLVLHYSAKVNQTKLELKREIRKVHKETHDAAQAAILEQALLFDRELRKLQDEVRELKRSVEALKTTLTPSSGEHSPKQIETVQNIVEAFVVAKKKGLRRMCIAGRGWVPVKRVQNELNLCDQEVKYLCSA